MDFRAVDCSTLLILCSTLLILLRTTSTHELPSKAASPQLLLANSCHGWHRRPQWSVDCVCGWVWRGLRV